MIKSASTWWLVVIITIATLVAVSRIWPPVTDKWSDADVAVLRSLWIGSLGELPPDPTNVVADDPRAAKLGHALFFSTSLSPSKAIACATCHRPELRFTDGMQKGRGVGQSKRNTRSIVGVA